MAAGAGCYETAEGAFTDQYECAWTGQFGKLLSRWIGHPVEVINRAKGGTQSGVAVASAANLIAKHESIDIVFTDFSVNDAVEGAGLQQQLLNGDLGLVTEALILSIARLLPNALHVVVLQDCPKCWSDAKEWTSILSPPTYEGELSGRVPPRLQAPPVAVQFGAATKLVAAHHRVPVLDFRLPCRVGGNCTWSPRHAPVHPDASSHSALASQALFAFQMAYGWGRGDGKKDKERQGKQGNGQEHDAPSPTTVLKPSLYPASQVNKLMACLEPLSSYDAYDRSATAQQPRLESGWEWTNELRRGNWSGKPGWIGNRVGATISFNLTFGRHPSFVLTYLRSYESLGAAEISLNGQTRTIDPIWESKTSQTEAMFVQAGAHASWSESRSGLKGFGVRGYSALPLTFKFVGPRGKFKIISVASC